ncbi:MAG: hypothetical protein ACJ8AH_00745 [Stellaceae bacterium]
MKGDAATLDADAVSQPGEMATIEVWNWPITDEERENYFGKTQFAARAEGEAQKDVYQPICSP